MYISEFVVLQLVLLLCALYAQAERVLRPKFKEIKTWSDNYYLKHDVAFDENDPHMNITLHVLREIHDVDIYVHSSIVHKDNINHYMNFNTTFSLCHILLWRDQSPIGNLAYAYLKEYGKLVETCPIPKDTKRTYQKFFYHNSQGKYYMHKFWLPEDPSTAKLPEVDFEIDILSYHLDEQKQRTLMIEDHITGEAIVQEVGNKKRGLLSMAG